jgi:hypothetical protein
MKPFFLLLVCFSAFQLSAQEIIQPFRGKEIDPSLLTSSPKGKETPRGDDSTTIEWAGTQNTVLPSLIGFKSLRELGFWGRLNNSAVISGLSNQATGSIYTDLLVDTIGLWKLSFASALAASDNDTIQNLQTFLAGGGNAILKGSYPVAFWCSPSNPGTRNMTLYLMPRVGMSLPALGGSAEGFSWNADIGVETHVFLETANQLIGLTGRARLAVTHGNSSFTDTFVKQGQNTMAYAQFNAGLLLKRTVSVQVTFPVAVSGSNQLFNQTMPALSVGFVL